ncbi:ABC transporter ATP-binding protein [Rhodococcus sp. RS1C4]|uniref:ABC transporter ATP-binding protein n=1 Tax=Nocardiaceae TaxID=85025 RepID=UPI00037770B2|nr:MULTISPECIES: ABC transporter ATP-binding protein [Rhodococcus]OZC53127.1 ABC transporter ATP-binding protein [Rhodococcus sp. RS1C4]OZC79277.1 ABC transporter ATP-binding protein [Rhodococcus sp. 06-418-1B]OZD15074.1 ABC transporter ATP-binding protein [Rhodococcus sp. 06-156-4C]OZD19842.1 ABC transporter ATP-binding protein [Rhodococcus sp. 06-156-4a]OZD22851.1 ABC transporter ATP-binding protein [Rhodococcus sp. 06-156-3C]
MLVVSDLHVQYGKVSAVTNIGLTVEPGRITLVLGANGAGKSTTLRTIAGLVEPMSGTIVLDDVSLVGLKAHKVVRRGISLVPEGRQVFASLSVAENLRIGGYTSTREKREKNTELAYELFPILRERKDGPAGLLSGGEQQMLAFGRGLMSDPKYIMMDEPSMGLAPAVVDTVMASVREIADRGLGVLMVEQNAEAGLRVADDVVVVNRGDSVYSGGAEEARSHSSVVLAFLGEAALGA